MTGGLRRLLDEPSVRWLVTARALALLAAPLSLYLLVTRQSLSARGFYLIAINIAALGQLFETGMGTLVVQLAARAGPAERGLLRRDAERWYSRAAIVFFALAGTAGSYVLGAGARSASVHVLVPWSVVVASTALYIRIVPLVCLREGGGDVEAVQRMRAVQALAVAVATILGLRFGRGMDAAAWASLAQLASAGWFVLRRRGALPPRGRAEEGPDGSFRREQGRSARAWLALWTAPQLLTPAVMVLRDASAAGDVGLHVALALAPAVLGIAWMHARYPIFGELVATGALRAFDDTARHAFVQAMSVFATASAVLVVLAFAGPFVFPFLAGRVLSPLMLVALLVGTLMLVLMQAMLAWFRAFGDERLAPQVVMACAAMGAGAIAGAAVGGAIGSSLGFGSVGLLVTGMVARGFGRLRVQRLLGP